MANCFLVCVCVCASIMSQTVGQMRALVSLLIYKVKKHTSVYIIFFWRRIPPHCDHFLTLLHFSLFWMVL